MFKWSGFLCQTHHIGLLFPLSFLMLVIFFFSLFILVSLTRSLFFVLFFPFLFFVFLLHHEAYRILVPDQGLNPCPVWWKCGVLTSWTTREVLRGLLIFSKNQLLVSLTLTITSNFTDFYSNPYYSFFFLFILGLICSLFLAS